MVEKSSAVLNHQQERTRMKVDGDHSQIAKLKPGQGGVYPNVLQVIREGLQSASEQYTALRKEADAPQPPPEDVTAGEDEDQTENSDEIPMTMAVCFATSVLRGFQNGMFITTVLFAMMATQPLQNLQGIRQDVPQETQAV